MSTGKVESAIAKFFKNYTCGQALLLAYSDSKNGVDPDTAMKVGSVLGSGLGIMGETCGAVMGAILLIGYKHGQKKIEDQLERDTTNLFVQEFIVRFRARHGHIRCKKLLDRDFSTVDGARNELESPVSFAICPGFIKSAIEILDEIFEADDLL